MDPATGATTFVGKMRDFCPNTDPPFARHICVCLVLTIVFITSLVGTGIMWFTDIYYEEIINQMTIREGSEVYEAWRKPPVQPLICVHVYNYTNMPQFLAGNVSKIHLEEVGPYCYRETLEKKNVTFNDDGTVTYGDTRRHEFEPFHSRGKKDDILYVPNLALISTLALTKDLPAVPQLVLSLMLRDKMALKTMIAVEAHEFLFGYEDKLIALAKELAVFFGRKVPFEKFGILTQRAAITEETTTVRTGTNDVARIGIVTEINGETELGVWPEVECNRIDGSDGTFFPRHTISENATLYLFHKDLCRRMPFVYDKEVDFQDGIMAMRFHAAPNVYNTNGTCYCPNTGCAPDGIFDLSPCASGVPLLISFPHFLYGDPLLSEPFVGLHPDPNKHEFYIDIQRLLGFTLGTVSRLQLNIKVQKSRFTSLLKEFPNELILPIVWVQVSAEKMPPDLFNIIYHATFTVKRMQIALQWTCLITTLVALFCLIKYIKGTLSKNDDQKKKISKESSTACCEEMLPITEIKEPTKSSISQVKESPSSSSEAAFKLLT